MKRTFTLLILWACVALVSRSMAQCSIENVTAIPSDCDGAHFYVSLDFEFVNVGTHGFKVQGNGINHGVFSYDDLPVTLGPLPGDGTTTWEFVVRDVDHPDCNAVGTLAPVSCSSGDCSISNLQLDPGDCHSDGTYRLWINFDYENAPNDFFDVYYQGQHIGFFELADLPVMIEHFDDGGNPHPVVSVCINDTPDCCAEADFTAPNCSSPCAIWDLEVVPSDCVDGMFDVTLNFNHENTGSAGFKVQGNGITYGVFSYDDLPLTLGPLAGNGSTPYEFLVKDVQHGDCSAVFELGTVECPSTGDCEISNAHADPISCNDDGTYKLAIDFSVANAQHNFFFVKYKGELIVHHAPIANLPYYIEHFDDDGAPDPHVLICIEDQPDCCVEVPFVPLDCPPAPDCHIYDVIAEAHPCDGGQFLVDIAFQHQGTGDDGFTIFGNGVNYGTFQYGEPFYTIGPLEGNGKVYEFVIKDLQHPGCKGFTHIGPVHCDGACHIYDLEAEVSDCNDQGQFFVTLDFQHQGTGDDGFKVVGNGNSYGIFSYDDLPLTLGPLTTDLKKLEFVVKDVQHPDCHDAVAVHVPDCDGGGGDCFIADLVVDVHPCLSNGTFYVTLDFFHEATSGFFKVHGNGINYGVFSYDDLPVIIGPLVGNGTTPYEFAVTDVHHHDCGTAVDIGPVQCDPSGDCAVYDLLADAGSCQNDDTYHLWFNFEVANPGNNFYDVFLDGHHVTTLPLSHVPAVLPHVPSNDEPLQTLTVCINDQPGCCDTVQYESPDCNTANPVWPGDANADRLVNHFDVLSLGLAFGTQGPERVDKGTEWVAFFSENWPQYFSAGHNYKHADCNGDGKIDADDLHAIFLNYGKSNGTPQLPVFLEGDENQPPLYVDLPDGGIPKFSATFTAPIIFGTESLPVEDAYGLAFTIHFDPEVIDPASVELDFESSWLGNDGVDLMVLEKKYPTEGKIELVLVRTDGQQLSGYGQVAKFIGIIDNIAGRETVRLQVDQVKAIRSDETLIAVYAMADEAPILTNTTEQTEAAFLIYPNPASDWLYITPLQGDEVVSWMLRNAQGATLANGDGPLSSLDLSELPAGVYTIGLQTEQRHYVAKVVKVGGR